MNSAYAHTRQPSELMMAPNLFMPYATEVVLDQVKLENVRYSCESVGDDRVGRR